MDVVDRMESRFGAGKGPARRSNAETMEDPVDHRRRNLSHFPSWQIPVDGLVGADVVKISGYGEKPGRDM